MKKMIVTIAIILIIGVVIIIAFKFLMINTKDSVVDSREYLGIRNNPDDIYAIASDGSFYSPLNIDVVPMDQLMLVDIKDDPEYRSIELQTFDDSRGQGAIVILYRHEGPVDVYFTNSIFKTMISENARYVADPGIAYFFEVTDSGLHASLKMKDAKGKSIEFRIEETLRKKWSNGFLAPVGGSKDITFDYFPFFHMKHMNFVLRSGTEISITIDGAARKPKKMPMRVDKEFVYISRYTDDPVMANFNMPHDGPLFPFPGNQQFTDEAKRTSYELVNHNGHYEISKMTGFNENHEASFQFSPPVPDLVCLKDKFETEGHFCAGADSVNGIVAGTYHIKRDGNLIEMEINPLEAWQPIPGKLWVRTWMWKSSITVSSDKSISMRSSWIRDK